MTAAKDLVRRYFEMWNTGEVSAADEVLAESWVDHAHPEITGRDDVKQAVRKVRTALPDLRFHIEAIVAEGDLVAVRRTVTRTVDGNPATSQGMAFLRVAGGRLAEQWSCD